MGPLGAILDHWSSPSLSSPHAPSTTLHIDFGWNILAKLFKMAIFYAFFYLWIAVAMAGAVPSIGPLQTPMGMMATIGFSPLPTEAPGSNGIPQELRKRQNVRFPPPAHWCGFIEGFYSSSNLYEAL